MDSLVPSPKKYARRVATFSLHLVCAQLHDIVSTGFKAGGNHQDLRSPALKKNAPAPHVAIVSDVGVGALDMGIGVL